MTRSGSGDDLWIVEGRVFPLLSSCGLTTRRASHGGDVLTNATCNTTAGSCYSDGITAAMRSLTVSLQVVADN